MLQNHMTEKSKNRVCLKTPPIITNSNPSVVRRGRPKGSKNKPKISHSIDIVSPSVTHKAKRGRPKGAKNKPKTSPAVENIKAKALQKKRTCNQEAEKSSEPPKKRGRPFKVPQSAVSNNQAAKPGKDVQLEEHPLLKALKWLEKYMHPAEMLYYRSRATKLGVSLHVAMASDVLGLFNVQDPEICKQIKKNNFIANNNPYVIH
jgi:hypothetical protein